LDTTVDDLEDGQALINIDMSNIDKVIEDKFVLQGLHQLEHAPEREANENIAEMFDTCEPVEDTQMDLGNKLTASAESDTNKRKDREDDKIQDLETHSKRLRYWVLEFKEDTPFSKFITYSNCNKLVGDMASEESRYIKIKRVHAKRGQKIELPASIAKLKQAVSEALNIECQELWSDESGTLATVAVVRNKVHRNEFIFGATVEDILRNC
jgi:hypothetical protein